MKGYKDEQVINGSWGEVWVDDNYMAEATALKAEVSVKTTSIARIQTLTDGQKITGYEGKGELKLHKVSSFVMNKMSTSLKAGKMPSATIVSNLKDPDALGAERVALYNCVFDKLILADWESGKMGEESYSFTFTDWKLIDTIKSSS